MVMRFSFYMYLVLVPLACTHMSGKRDVRTDEEIQSVFDRNRARLDDIYAEFLDAKPDLGGRIVFSITIEASGRVSRCRVRESAIANPAVGAAVCDGIRSLDFGGKNTGRISILRPIDFYPR